MALSVLKARGGPIWLLGAITVPTIGTPVCIMNLVDANNVNAPGSASNNQTSEYSPACRGIGLQGYHPGANNNGMVINGGNIYILFPGVGNNSGNRSDSGAMWKVLPPGGDLFLASQIPGVDMISPYAVFLDADANNDGALVALYGPTNP